MKRKGSLILALALFLALFAPLTATAKVECSVCGEMEGLGFPSDYARALCTLKKGHPKWNFIPLLIKEEAGEKREEYTFFSVVEEEIRIPNRSLIAPSSRYAPYRHPSAAVFDSGYYRASFEAVAYFLDPRNHLSEKGVFQFLILSGGAGVGEEALSHALSGTAAEKVFSPKDLLSVSEKTGVDALYLAIRLRQEQGFEGNSLLWGNTGKTLLFWYENKTRSEGDRLILTPSEGVDGREIQGLDGIYNPLNVSASGEGVFSVLLSGGRHGKKMGWTTPFSGLLGGAEKIKREYLDLFQNTLYLQKWNVDPRSVTETGASRNFWGQYMQNISSPVTEGALLYNEYEKAHLSQGALSFLIPVFDALPSSPSPDPAGGEIAEFSSEILLCSGAFSPPPTEKAEKGKEAFLEETYEEKKDETKGKEAYYYLGIALLLLLLLHRIFVSVFAFFSRKKRFFYQK